MPTGFLLPVAKLALEATAGTAEREPPGEEEERRGPASLLPRGLCDPVRGVWTEKSLRGGVSKARDLALGVVL